VLRCKAMDLVGPERATYQILDDDRPAEVAGLERVARFGDALLRENGLDGRFLVTGPGVLTLELVEAQRSFFHNGIVFAALDAFNDPVRNPTLNLSADDVPR
jgi:hypothetical protein